jgi:hypothetical protein
VLQPLICHYQWLPTGTPHSFTPSVVFASCQCCGSKRCQGLQAGIPARPSKQAGIRAYSGQHCVGSEWLAPQHACIHVVLSVTSRATHTGGTLPSRTPRPNVASLWWRVGLQCCHTSCCRHVYQQQQQHIMVLSLALVTPMAGLLRVPSLVTPATTHPLWCSS